MPAPVISLAGVSHAFEARDGRPVLALDKIDIAIARHEFVAVIGPSGCGKSTILRILAGLIRPTQGEVLYHAAPHVDVFDSDDPTSSID